jgi:hypothetical protein
MEPATAAPLCVVASTSTIEPLVTAAAANDGAAGTVLTLFDAALAVAVPVAEPIAEECVIELRSTSALLAPVEAPARAEMSTDFRDPDVVTDASATIKILTSEMVF